MPKGKKLKLQRTNHPVNENQIKKNLENLQQNVQKKRQAQQAWYRNHANGASPLIKNEKEPVHQRLGLKENMRLRKVPFNGTNTSAILPKKKFILQRNNMTNDKTPKKKFFVQRNNMTNNKTQRIFSAQSRLNRIRQQQQQQLQNNRPNQLQKKTFKLRRSLGNDASQPPNLTVQVQNSTFSGTSNVNKGNYGRRFKQILNRKLQQEIRDIQSAQVHGQALLPIMKITPAITETKMNERFATY